MSKMKKKVDEDYQRRNRMRVKTMRTQAVENPNTTRECKRH